MWQLSWFNGVFVVLVVSLKSEVLCSTMTNESYRRMRSDTTNMFRTRQHRLISFDSQGDIRLDLDFTVPFITLPIKTSMDTAKTSLVNLNVGALVLSGAVVFGAAVAVPVILALFNKKSLIPAQNPFNILYTKMGSQRSEDSYFWKYLTALDTSLSDNDIDLTTCSQRLMCLTVKNSSENVAMGRGSSTDKVFDGIVSSQWFQKNILNSVLSEAAEFGLRRENCSSIYKRCKFNHEVVYYLVNRVLDQFSRG